LEQVEKSRRRSDPAYNHPELVLPELPAAVAHLWEWYLEIQTGERLTFGEIKAWAELTGREIAAHEAKALRSISFAHFSAINQPPET
jgi:hypothetical protein